MSYRPGIEEPGTPQTMWDRLHEVALQDPDKQALLFVDDERREHTLSFRELVQQSETLSVGLVSLGVRPGDRVAIILTSRLEWVLCCFAVMRIGATLVPVNTRLLASEIGYVLRQARASHVIALDRFRRIDLVERLREIMPGLANATSTDVSQPELPDLRSITLVKRDGEGDGDTPAWSRDFLELMDVTQDDEARSQAQAFMEVARPDDLGMIKYTSGSTGFPKGAMLDQGGIVRTALVITQRLGTDNNEKWFTAMPFFHVGGSVWALLTALTRGSTLVFTESHGPRVALELIERERCTVVYGVPAMIRDLLAELRVTDRDLSSVWLISATTSALIEEVTQRIPSVTTGLNAFGSTETFGPFSVVSPADPPGKRLTTMGQPLPGNEIRVIDPATGSERPAGVPGEGLLRGGIMKGYWDAPEQNATTFDADGWFHSGDLVTVDTDGYVTWLGRYKAMLKVGGENIAAEEVENRILEHPDVLDAILVGVPDPRLDQVPRAYLELQADVAFDPEALRRWCASTLAPFKVPKEFLSVERLPRTGSGKIDRAAVQGWVEGPAATEGRS